MNPEYYLIYEDHKDHIATGPYASAKEAQAHADEWQLRNGAVKITRLVSVSHTVVTHATTWNAPYEIDGFYIGADEMDP
jgi:hypothetical protein